MTTDLATFNPFDPASMQCPFPHYEQMRDEKPVMLIESVGMYLVTNHDLVMQVLRDPATYSTPRVAAVTGSRPTHTEQTWSPSTGQ